VINLTVKQNESTEKNIVVGVFITKKHAQALITMNPDFINSYRYIRYIELAKANQDLDVTLYLFTTDDVSFEKKYVMGIYYNHQEEIWQQKTFPLPDLLYDRGGGTSQKAMLVIKKLRELGIKNINARHYFDKWDLYDRLSKLDTMSPHLPVTIKGDKAKNIVTMLNQYGHVYVKTRRGSCGTGVIRIEKHGPDKFRYYYSYGSKLFSEIFSEQELMKILYRFFAHKPFIIQKSIDLMKKDQCIIDFRSEVQKNKDGQFIITGTTARIGRSRSPIASNTHKEDYYPIEKFLRYTMKFDALTAGLLQAKINRFLQTVFRAAEQVYGSFGEMGIDFGLDTQGHLWLIECNSKSAKVALYNAFGRQKVRESFFNLLQYAKYLVEKQNNNNT
jgi:hypothetical protein